MNIIKDLLAMVSTKKVKVAEREGFEPSMGVLYPYSLSRRNPINDDAFLAQSWIIAT
mgnify:CR=1 FL=1